MLPLLLLVLMNALNFAYFFLVILNLTGAARSATLYSIEGSYTPYATQEPPAGTGTCATLTTTPGTVAYTAYQDLTGALGSPTASTTKIQVCSQINTNSATGSGVNTQGSQQLANCMVCDSSAGCSAANAYSGNPAPAADPEQPSFVLNQVDIKYQFKPLFPGKIFNIAMQAMPSAMCTGGACTWVRTARMRSMGP